MFPKGAGVIRGDVILARETFLNAQETRRGTVTVSPAVFGAPAVAMVFVNCGEVRPAALRTSEEGLGAFAVGDRVTQTEAATALDESRAAFEGSDGGFAAEKIRR
jgi:hypothetical protein